MSVRVKKKSVNMSTPKHLMQCCQSVGFCPKSQDFWSPDLLICKLGMLGFFFNMVPLSTIYLQTILGFLNQVLRILVKKCWQHC